MQLDKAAWFTYTSWSWDRHRKNRVPGILLPPPPSESFSLPEPFAKCSLSHAYLIAFFYRRDYGSCVSGSKWDYWVVQKYFFFVECIYFKTHL